MEASGFDAGSCVRERGGEDDCAGDRQGIGGVGLFWRHIDPGAVGEWCGIEPGAIGEQGIAADVSDRGFEMETAGHWNRDDFVVMRREGGRELANALGVGARGEADIQRAIDAEYITAFDGSGRGDVRELAEFLQGVREGSGFGAARFGAEGKNHGELIEDDGGIFDKHRIGERGFRRKRDDFGAERFEELLVGAMLFAGFVEVDGAAAEESEFAVDDGGADGAGDGGEHDRRKVYMRLLD